jgi:long-chain acyl-CoA synthetase
MIEHPLITKRYQDEVKRYNQHFGDFEQIKRYLLVPEEWTPALDFLSPTLKIKRDVIEAYYADKIEKIFT